MNLFLKLIWAVLGSYRMEQTKACYGMKSAWTINENAAFTFEFRHRSKFDWKKSDYDNYILDIARPIDELLHSPLWTAHLESHIGTGRKNDPDFKLAVLPTGRWQVEFGYKYSPSTRQWVFPSVKLLNARF